MAGVLDGVDRRTKIAGHNRLELLLFHLGRRQHFGINVFKVQEVIQCPPLTNVPHSHPSVRGVANMRGKTITVMDLAMAIGQPPIQDIENAFIIITEYNRSTQGFLVGGVERIVNLTWDSIKPPPKGVGSNYMTAVTEVEDKLVEIIDVEKVLSEIIGVDETVDEAVIEESQKEEREHVPHILVIDDSSVARNQIKHTLVQIGLECTLANNGREGLDKLKEVVDADKKLRDVYDLVISDVEMPEMDGYTFTTAVREDPRMDGIYIILHTSLSGVFNQSLVEKVGANKFISKFNPDELANAVLDQLRKQASL
ncbi:MAG: chemotaxis protein CheV [Chromatiales bacterium]|nr:chemotaxis protein CheV [Chromatiales bacterium]